METLHEKLGSIGQALVFNNGLHRKLHLGEVEVDATWLVICILAFLLLVGIVIVVICYNCCDDKEEEKEADKKKDDNKNEENKSQGKKSDGQKPADPENKAPADASKE